MRAALSKKWSMIPSKNLAVLVTGCDSGFGKEISTRLSSRGFTVFAGMLKKKRTSNNPNLIPLQMDVTSSTQVQNAFKEVEAWCNKEKNNSLFCVVNNAGVQRGCLVEWTSMKDYEMMFQVNTLGTIRVTKTFLPLLFRSSQLTKRIINVTSVNGFVPLPGISGYASSKHATEAFTNVLRWELEAYRDIKVVNINPGTFRTPMTSNASGQIRRAYDTASIEAKDFFGENMIRSAETKVREFIDFAGDPVLVVDALEDAATSISPQSRYFVGWDAKFLWKSWSDYVPHCVRDFVLTLLLRTCLPPSQTSSSSSSSKRIFRLMPFILLLLFVMRTTAASPPCRDPPEHLLSEFTMNATIPISQFYVDDSNEGLGTHYKFSREYISNAMKAVSTLRFQRQHEYLTDALRDHSIRDHKVAIYGSMEPVFESLALVQGANRTFTIEFNKLTFEHEHMITRTVEEEERSGQKYDSAFSISSFDHTGLGRYNDPLHPNGDVESMNTVFDSLRPGGILFLTVPIGPDRLIWNLMRIYGEIRLPLLLGSRPWIELGRYGWNEDKLTRPVRNWRRTYEPVFVLQKPIVRKDYDDGEL